MQGIENHLASGENPVKIARSCASAAQGAAISAANDVIDVELAAVIGAWPTLPESTKLEILAIVCTPGVQD